MTVADQRKRHGGTIAQLAAREDLLALPGVAFPAVPTAERVVSRMALVAFEGTATASRPVSSARP